MTRSAEMVWDQGKKPTKLGGKRLLRWLRWHTVGCLATLFGSVLLLISVVIMTVINLVQALRRLFS